MKTVIRLATAVEILMLFGCAPWNAQTRKVPYPDAPAFSPGDSAYIESKRKEGTNYGCSFIEFDGRGGFLNFPQYSHAKAMLQKLKAKSNVLLVIYCHGWNNNAQSADVIRFLSFLRHLNDSGAIRSKGLRVEGVYLGWRGSQFKPVVASSDVLADRKLAEDFDLESLVDPRWQLPSPLGLLLTPAKLVSYWSIKDRGEFHVSRVPLSRAVFGLAFSLKTPEDQAKDRNHRVFVLGHSFGAMVLEQAIGQASVGLLTSEWNRGQHEARWPIDLIVFLNSAAPSLYAKQLSEFLQDDYRTTAKPRIISLTSTGDWATGSMHPLGNVLSRFSVDLQRKYYPQARSKPVTAGEYYSLTPGHNKVLINHKVERDDAVQLPAEIATNEDEIFARNLRPVDGGDTPDIFFARSAKDHQVYAWRLEDITINKNRKGSHASNYWIGTVPKDIIRDHNDIWTPASMEMLAGIYRITERLGKEAPPKLPKEKANQD